MKILKATKSGFEGLLLSRKRTIACKIRLLVTFLVVIDAVGVHCVLHSSSCSSITGFVRDQFTTLPETSDRTFCTRVFAKYEVDGSAQDVEFNGIW